MLNKLHWSYVARGFPASSVVKNSLVNAGDSGDKGFIPGLGRSPGGGNGHPSQDSCLDNPMDRRAWWTTVPMAATSQTWLTTQAHMFLRTFKLLRFFKVFLSFFPFPYILIIKPFLQGFFFFYCLKLPIEKLLNKKVFFTDLFTYSISAFLYSNSLLKYWDIFSKERHIYFAPSFSLFMNIFASNLYWSLEGQENVFSSLYNCQVHFIGSRCIWFVLPLYG